VIGVHAPEFAFEKDPANVRHAVRELGISYPVALDNDRTIWRGFRNRYWPAHYFIDGKGRIRHHHFGEGDYPESEKVIQRLLAENGHAVADSGMVTVAGTGIAAASDWREVGSPETYVGYGRGERFASAGGYVPDARHVYALPPLREVNQWGLAGDWTVGRESAAANAAGAKVAFRFQARDLHLVLGPPPGGEAVRFRVTVDGKSPAGDHGLDVDAAGMGRVTEQRLYQLVRQKGPAVRTFEIEFLDPGVQVFAFTFG
jgi:hypothetical protein